MSSTVEQIVSSLTQEGYLIELNVSRWSAEARLTEADLGLEGLTSDELHRLGRRLLVKKASVARIAAVEARARARLHHRSFEFPFGGARFVPAKMLGLLLSELAALRTEFETEVEAFVEEYESLAAEMRGAWLENARGLAERLDKPETWLTEFDGRLEQAYPSKVKVRGAFAIGWSLYQFALPQGLQIKLIDAKRASEVAKLALEAKQQIEARVQTFVSEASQALRQRAADLCIRVREQIGNAKFSEKSLAPLRELISEFRAMDFTGDHDFAETLERLEADFLGDSARDSAARQVRESATFRESFGAALDAVAQKVEGEAGKVVTEACERFLRQGNLGRKLAG